MLSTMITLAGSPSDPAAGENTLANLPWSEAVADALTQVLKTDPFTEYQSYLTVFRVDTTSEDDGITSYLEKCDFYSAQHQQAHDTAFGMEWGAGTALRDWRHEIGVSVASRLVPDWNRLIMMANGFIPAISGSEIALTKSVIAKGSNRRWSTLHELGHLVSKVYLTDERADETNRLTDSTRAANSVLWWKTQEQAAYVPPLETANPSDVHIEWSHWILGPDELCAGPPDVPVTVCAGGSVSFCPEGEGEGLCSPEYCSTYPGAPCRTPLPTLVGDTSITAPVGLYPGGAKTQYGYRPQPSCVMNGGGGWQSSSQLCRPCREQLIININAEVENQIRDSWVSLEGDLLVCHAEIRKPLNHSLDIQWTIAPPEQGACEACPAEGEGEGAPGPGTEIHQCCFDTTTWSSGPHTITLTVTDKATVNGEAWVLPAYLYAKTWVNANSWVGYSFSRDMVNTVDYVVSIP